VPVSLPSIALRVAVFAFGAARAGAESRDVGALLPKTVASPAPVSGAVRSLSRNWPKYCANLEMTGVAEGERSISPSSAPALELACTDTLTGAIASSPTVVAGRVYVGDWSGIEWSIDAATGAVLARTNLGTTSVPWCYPSDLGITSAPAFSGGVLYLAGGDVGFYALDAKDLSIRWRTSLGDNSGLGGYYGWCSPAVFGGRVIQGVSSNCDDPFIEGRLNALDAGAGAILASADLAQTTDHWKEGAGVWTSPAIDVEAGQIFATSGSAYHYDDGLAYSILRFSLADLSVEDHWKLSPEDFALALDADWGSSPTLFRDAAGNRLVGAGQKNGYYYAFSRDDLAGGPLWKAAIATPGFCPQCGEGTLSTAAFDGKRLYVGGGTTARADALGSIVALDPGTGAELWWTPMSGPVLAPVSFANGVVFAAGGTSVVALDAETGAVLWHAGSSSVLYGGIAISDGRSLRRHGGKSLRLRDSVTGKLAAPPMTGSARAPGAASERERQRPGSKHGVHQHARAAIWRSRRPSEKTPSGRVAEVADVPDFPSPQSETVPSGLRTRNRSGVTGINHALLFERLEFGRARGDFQIPEDRSIPVEPAPVFAQEGQACGVFGRGQRPDRRIRKRRPQELEGVKIDLREIGGHPRGDLRQVVHVERGEDRLDVDDEPAAPPLERDQPSVGFRDLGKIAGRAPDHVVALAQMIEREPDREGLPVVVPEARRKRSLRPARNEGSSSAS
jgi:outer membrane protein assembly factor BamB